jgi:hypothetical protein
VSLHFSYRCRTKKFEILFLIFRSQPFAKFAIRCNPLKIFTERIHNLMSKARNVLQLFIILSLSFGSALPALAQDATAESPEEAAATETTPIAVSMPPLAELIPGEWNTLIPGGETECARETPFQFFVLPAKDSNTDKLLIYYQGGGACWDLFTCSAGGTGMFDNAVGSAANEVGGYNGIFDFTNPANPVADYNMVFIPYCTADVHIGDAVVDYGARLVLHHNGYNNSTAVLNWTYENFDAPDDIVVAGTSAGAYGAIQYAPYIMDHYPDARVVQFGDAGVGATPVGWQGLQTWGMYSHLPDFVPGLEEVDPETYTLSMIYDSSAAYYPDDVFAQYTTDADEVQMEFYNFSVLGDREAPSWAELMADNLAGLNTANPNFYSYIAEGESHTILAYPEFYTRESDGVLIRDWFAALVNGDPVEDVVCKGCAGALGSK